MSIIYSKEDVLYEKIQEVQQQPTHYVELTDKTMLFRKKKVLKKMSEFGYDTLIIYADLEHCGNFEYLTGFTPRFEEALLIFHQNSEAFGLLGNETLKMENFSRLPFRAILSPCFSLPDQPFDIDEELSELITKAGITNQSRVGLVGWKLFSNKMQDSSCLTDLPNFIYQGIRKIVPVENLKNATDLFIHPDYGVRTTNNENELAHYIYGQVLASNGIINTIDHLELEKNERELASFLEAEGQRNTVVTICSAGERFKKANLYPSDQQIKMGDRFSMTVGYKGGLASRSGYVVSSEDELIPEKKNYLPDLAKPYFAALATWLKNIRIGLKGREFYDIIDQSLPQEKYHWHLNPGHLVADEEWLSSPIFKNSKIPLKSGMMLQIDIIPSVIGYDGVSAENGIALADKDLREKLTEEYPEIWEEIQKNKLFMKDELGLKVSDEVLPLSNIVGYLPPFLLNKNYVLKIK